VRPVIMTGSASDHSRPMRDVQAGIGGTRILWKDPDVQKHHILIHKSRINETSL